MNDKDIYDLAKILEEDCIDFDICQLEIHHINPDFVSTGTIQILRNQKGG